LIYHRFNALRYRVAATMLLIDGYNLLHATSIFGQGASAGTLRGSREALLAFLVRRLPSKLLTTTTIVFDAASAPPGLPEQFAVQGLSIRFARNLGNADALLEQLIEECRAPKALLVVSGDHRVQRAARSRGAKYIDSEAWFTELRRRPAAPLAEPTGNVRDSLEEWIHNFSDPVLLAEYEQAHRQLEQAPLHREPPPEKKPPRRRRGKGPMSQRAEEAAPPFGEGLDDIFPPGYADDLLTDQD
jgi:predicted RNA-binding protein with PIN domain